ncbi:type IV toxin-antitoxin system AbiEi family antitoxin domain-containing protein [Mycetocola sp. JXN-3]|uniref:type IV toxin-antitoxin system AbiEi family antitoxin domain-containing protein n=1 Tax=Mycetocola sp. JXN-3 TaxID=2116510 RepID=UPI00165D01B2|nr:type IV toxin-antitoxin system AbiEi family antitoxin domain-containing protein [Mycetocola sp. JXN-3]
MSARIKYRDVLREMALDRYGYVTTREAIEAGVPAVELPKLAARGGLEHVARGIYRVSTVPPTRNDQLAEAILRAGEGAYLYAESVLSLFDLADLNPRRIKVAVHRRTRTKLPAFIELTRVHGEPRTTVYDGLNSQYVADALLSCSGRIEPPILLIAAQQARAEGLLLTSEFRHLRRALRS